MFRNTAEYLEEWLLFHIVVGFDHFYLYNNESTDGWRQVVNPFIENGYVTVVDFPGDARQKEGYDDCITRFRNESEWIAFFDDDEFLYPCTLAKRNEPGSLWELLQDYRDYAGVTVNWLLYGSSGYKKKKAGWVIRRFIQRKRNADQHPKCLMNMRNTSHCMTVGHLFAGKEGCDLVNERKEIVDTPLHEAPSAEILRMNHYISKSIEELIDRRSRVMVNTGRVSKIDIDSWIDLDKQWNELEDDSAHSYIPAMEALRAEIVC